MVWSSYASLRMHDVLWYALTTKVSNDLDSAFHIIGSGGETTVSST